MDNCISDPEVLFRQLSARMVESAAYSAECQSAALYLCGDDGSAAVAASFGGAFRPIAPLAFASLMEAMSGLESDGGIFFGGGPDGPTYGLCAGPEAANAARFVAAVRVMDAERQPLGVLAIADALPRRDLSPAKAYVLMTQALQIADAICLKRARERTDAQPRQSERLRLLESVVVNAKDSILITEAEPTALPGPRIVYCNAAFSATTGYSEAEVLGKTPRILQGPGTDPVARAKIREALLAWRPIEIELLNYNKAGEEFWVELSIVPVADERGWFTHWVSVQRDITERRIAQENQTRAMVAEAGNEKLQVLTDELREALDAAEAANVAKSQFLANMSHEIRTPLNGVLGMTQALWMDELTPVQRERVAIIRDCGRSLLAVLNDILDLSKIESGRLELELVDFDIDEMASAVCAAFTEVANRNGVSFGATLSDAVRGRWRGDSVRVRQILYNLVSNALKFTSEGEVHLHLDRTDQGGLRLAVRDTGMGIPADKLAGLFSKFYQTDSSITRRFGGTGLGLAICRELCDLMGGEIVVDSVEGEGSTFHVILPLEYLGGAAATAPMEAASGLVAVDDPMAAARRLRVLAAEDNSANQLVLRALLQAFEISPVIVSNGELAIEAWRDQPFDLIFMDIQMPVMDGITATRAIRAAEADLGRPRTPIIALSANAMTHQIREYLAAGMDGHVAKPIDIDQLAETLAAIADAAAAGNAQSEVPAALNAA